MLRIANLIIILLIISQVHSSCFAGSKEMDEQCSSYCYHVVKPLLQHASFVKSQAEQFTELNDKTKEQAATIVNLKEVIKQNDLQLALQTDLIALYKNNTHNHEKLIARLESENKILKAKDKDNFTTDSSTKPVPTIQSTSMIYIHLDEALGKYDNVPLCPANFTGPYSAAIYKPHYQVFECDSKMAGSGWTVIQRRIDGTLNFDREWNDYKTGFGDLDREFFIGLEQLHLMTNSHSHELFIYIADFANEGRYARYSHFAIGNEQESYEMKPLGTYSGNAGDGLRDHEYRVFSTSDSDRKRDSCAKTFRSGWWFGNCYKSNLNGIYATELHEGGFEWTAWKHKPLRFSQMMIRPEFN